MTTLYSFAAPVKTNRKFGQGILPTYPTYQAPYTAQDAAWWAANAPSHDDLPLDAELEQMFEEQAWQAAYEAGHVGF